MCTPRRQTTAVTNNAQLKYGAVTDDGSTPTHLRDANTVGANTHGF